ncbi:MAG: acylphosphatase [Acidobacteria bacterium]|jgi:acylphosphatase|nr:acylphosphatase [Acidobacteriota bacterium]
MASEERRTRRYRVYGRVQGVGFRAFVWRSASDLGLAGWVRNCYDGSVEVLAEAAPHDLLELEARLRRGPTWAHVSRVEVADEPPGTAPVGFSVRRDG